MQAPKGASSSSILKTWNDKYSKRVSDLEMVQGSLTDDLSEKFDQEATNEIKEEHPHIKFPIPLMDLNIPYGSALIFNAQSYLHAGGPGKNE